MFVCECLCTHDSVYVEVKDNLRELVVIFHVVEVGSLKFLSQHSMPGSSRPRSFWAIVSTSHLCISGITEIRHFVASGDQSWVFMTVKLVGILSSLLSPSSSQGFWKRNGWWFPVLALPFFFTTTKLSLTIKNGKKHFLFSFRIGSYSMTAVLENRTIKAEMFYDPWEVSLEKIRTVLFLSLSVM